MSSAAAREGGTASPKHSVLRVATSRAERDSRRRQRRAGAEARQALCQGVVVGIGGAAHAQGDAVGGGEIMEVVGGVLDAAIAVVEQAGRRRLGQARARVVVVSSPRMSGAAVVGDAAPGAGIEGEGEEEPAFGGFEVGEVALPDHL